MSSISYDFILTVVILELVFAFSIGVICILFSYNLFRAIKDSDSVDNLIIDDNSQLGSDDYHIQHHHHVNNNDNDNDDDGYAYLDEDSMSFTISSKLNYGSTTTTKDNHHNHHYHRQLGNTTTSNSSSSSNTPINISPPRYGTRTITTSTQTPPPKIKTPYLTNTNSPYRNLHSPYKPFNISLHPHTHVYPPYGGGGTVALEHGVETSFDEYILDENLSEFDVERRLCTSGDLQTHNNIKHRLLFRPVGSSLATAVEGNGQEDREKGKMNSNNNNNYSSNSSSTSNNSSSSSSSSSSNNGGNNNNNNNNSSNHSNKSHSSTESDKSSTVVHTITNDIYTVFNSFTPYLKLW